MTEFDTTVRRILRHELTLESPLAYEAFLQRLGERLAGEARQIGDGGNGELWLDVSTPLQTRYLVCQVLRQEAESGEAAEAGADGTSASGSVIKDPEASEEPGSSPVSGPAAGADGIHRYRIRIYSGTRSSRTGDVLAVLCVLGAFWFLGKCVTPAPAPLHVAGLAGCCLLLSLLAVCLGKPFGKKAAEQLEQIIEKIQP